MLLKCNFTLLPFTFVYSVLGATTGFTFATTLSAWIRVLPNKAHKMLLFEAQYVFNSVQKPAVRLFLIGQSLVFVDYVWNLCDSAATAPTSVCHGNLRAEQTIVSPSLSDGLWHFISVSLSTNRNNIPSSLADPDLIYLYGTRCAIQHVCCISFRLFVLHLTLEYQQLHRTKRYCSGWL